MTGFTKTTVGGLPDLEAWAIFARVVESGSFAAAATRLGLAPATVSKAIARLEARLGERLIQRTSRRFALTDAGRRLGLRAARILAEAEAAEADGAAHDALPRGRVRLAVPMSFGIAHVAPLLPAFLAAHPQVSVDLRLDDRVVDLVGDGIDIALRIAALPDSSLVARRLCRVERVVVGAPSYFAAHGTPARPADLAAHACLVYTYLPSGDSWHFGRDGDSESVAVGGPLSANNAEAFDAALAAGLGVALQPDFLCWKAVRDGRLVAVLRDWSAPPLNLHVVMPPGGPRPRRVTALIDVLVARFSDGAAPWAGVFAAG